MYTYYTGNCCFNNNRKNKKPRGEKIEVEKKPTHTDSRDWFG